MKLSTSSRFDNDLKKILNKNPKYKAKLAKLLGLLQSNVSASSLKLHKLKGNNIYSVSLDYSIRILMRISGDNIILVRIGTHDQVY